MEKKIGIRNLICGAFFVIGLSFLFTSCVKDELVYMDDNSQTTFKLNILANSEVITRAGTVSSELFVSSGFIFVFDASGAQVIMHELQPDVDIQNNGTNNLMIKAAISVAVGQQIALVLNTAKAPDLDLTSVTLDNIDTSFPLGNTGFEDVANETTKTGGLPMYGVHTWNGGDNVISIKRSVAKLQVMIDDKVHGSHSQYFMTRNVTYQLYNFAVNGKISAPSLSSGVNGSDINIAPTGNIIGEHITRASSETSDNFKGASYIYEYEYSKKTIDATSSSTVAGDTPSQNRFAIVLKNKGTSKFFRLDLFRKVDGKPQYIDILRNHHYKVIIKSVNSEGYATADEAFKGVPSNIEYQIEDNTGNTTITNGNCAISVGEEPLASTEVVVNANSGYKTCEIAHNVRFILRDSYILTLGGVNKISIIDGDGSLIPNATLSVDELTSDLVTLIVTLPTAVSLPVIKFKIELENLVFISEPFSLRAITNARFDCHEIDTRTINYKYTDVVWDVDPESLFIISNKTETSFDITPVEENVTPTSWETWNGTNYDVTSSEQSSSSVPIFTAKVSNGTLKEGIFIIIKQYAPIYVGRWGSPIEGPGYVAEATTPYALLQGPAGQPLRKRAIIEAREESDGMAWGSDVNPGGYNIANNGLGISKFGSVVHAGALKKNSVLNVCYKKNKGYKEGESLSAPNKVNWYLPAQQQLVGIWVSLSESGAHDGDVFWGESVNYWSSTENVPGSSWSVKFFNGRTQAEFKTNRNRVRCIMDL